MKTVILLLFVVFEAIVGRPQNPNQAYIVRYDNDVTETGSYSYNVETSDGLKLQQQGDIRNPGTDNEILAVQGSYSYVGDDGVTYTVTYIADENGFQPSGQHIPGSRTA